MSSAVYQLSNLNGLIANWPKAKLLRDKHAEELEDYEVDAIVRSGDYFVTLATIIDQLSTDVSDYHVRANLEEIISELIYLQDHYQITKIDSHDK